VPRLVQHCLRLRLLLVQHYCWLLLVWHGLLRELQVQHSLLRRLVQHCTQLFLVQHGLLLLRLLVQHCLKNI
jgi:hypothetical protein